MDENNKRLLDKLLLEAVRTVPADLLRVTILLEEGADPNTAQKNGTTALMYASLLGNTEIVKELRERGANVNARDKYGRTALWYAIAGRHTQIVRILVDAGIDVKVRDKYGESALEYAKRIEQIETVEILEKAAANKKQRDVLSDRRDVFPKLRRVLIYKRQQTRKTQ